MTRLNDLYEQCQQSPWIDNLKRSYVTQGELEKLIKQGIRGVTSNPTIFQKAISSSSDYDEEFSRQLQTKSVEEAYWELVIDDVTRACQIMRPVYESSGGGDGFVSLEVAPSLAHDTPATTEMARGFHERINVPNLMVKIPATKAGLPSIQQMIAEGRCINVTLIFSLERYGDVIEAYISGLEQCTGDLSNISSVASFFVSRVDTETDRRLDAVGSSGALELRGKAAVAQAQLAYELFKERFSGPRWDVLAARGARVQRPLWASTSTKNPAYDDLLYVDNLIGPNSVNTMPDATVEAFLDHGTIVRSVDKSTTAAEVWEALKSVGVDMDDVASVLEDEGVSAFQKSFDDLLATLSEKASKLKANA